MTFTALLVLVVCLVCAMLGIWWWSDNTKWYAMLSYRWMRHSLKPQVQWIYSKYTPNGFQNMTLSLNFVTNTFWIESCQVFSGYNRWRKQCRWYRCPVRCWLFLWWYGRSYIAFWIYIVTHSCRIILQWLIVCRHPHTRLVPRGDRHRTLKLDMKKYLRGIQIDWLFVISISQLWAKLCHPCTQFSKHLCLQLAIAKWRMLFALDLICVTSFCSL